MNKEIDPVYQL